MDSQTEIITSKKLQELVNQIDSREKLDEEVEDVRR
jgi:transcription initiation factor TFIID subunit TAF12